jgi:hypothetical protein
VAPGTALSTSPAFILWNPVASGVLISIKQVHIAYLSGTFVAGMMVHAQNPSQVTAPSGGTELTPVCALLNGTKGAGRVFTGSTISATSTIVRPSLTVGAYDGTTIVFAPMSTDDVDGSIVVPAGVAWCYQGITGGAGTTPKLLISAVYEEIVIP